MGEGIIVTGTLINYYYEEVEYLSSWKYYVNNNLSHEFLLYI